MFWIADTVVDVDIDVVDDGDLGNDQLTVHQEATLLNRCIDPPKLSKMHDKNIKTIVFVV